jgi:hypothetical protein
VLKASISATPRLKLSPCPAPDSPAPHFADA